jgi:type III secretory pathway lipoprotein EscJ
MRMAKRLFRKKQLLKESVRHVKADAVGVVTVAVADATAIAAARASAALLKRRRASQFLKKATATLAMNVAVRAAVMVIATAAAWRVRGRVDGIAAARCRQRTCLRSAIC